ncbi:MAG: polymer-forming cytoskeletal protein [Oscillospiraceae bacterium]|nr:polymer-forming cytoskeletal protein [Oscillospiraceae bacterium]
MDMKISGAGAIGAGEYDDVRISGSAKSEGLILCESFHLSGSFSGGEIECSEDFHVSGAGKFAGNIRAKEIHVSGAIKTEGNMKGKEIKLSGAIKTGGDVEAEEIKISGEVNCGGLINAERLYVNLDSTAISTAENIGGSKITIEKGRSGGFFCRLLKKSGKFIVSESIEGDEISIEYTSAKTVTGRNVKIGEKCEIGLVQYSESIEISPKAKIGKCEKI